MNRLFLLIVLLNVCTACKGQNNPYSSAPPILVKRFDQALYKLIDSNDTTLRHELLLNYPGMLTVTGKGILNIQSPDTPGFFERLTGYYSEPTLKEMYKDALGRYEDIQDIEQLLGSGFAYLKENLPSLPIPEIYMHVSGFGQNILVADNLLSVSIDKYMGKDYPLYRDFFYGYQQEKMQRSHVVPDYLAGWLYSEYAFTGRENVLLDRMVYEGKIKYLIANALPDMEPHELMGYTKEQYEWCKLHEGDIWKAMIENKHLFTPDYPTTGRYFDEMPNAVFTSEAPGNLGAWMGWQIIHKYMKKTHATVETLMRQTDAQELLTASKYKPF